MRRLYVCLAVLSFASTAGAATVIFGPQTYTVASGAPQRFERTFNIPAGSDCDGKALFTLVVENGSTVAGSKATSATVSLNGSIVVSENDLNANTDAIARPVLLNPANDLVVELKGGHPGAFLRISVQRRITDAIGTPLIIGTSGIGTTFGADSAGEYLLTLFNGESGGTRRARAGSIVINGAEVISSRDLSGSVTSLQVPLQLTSSNTFQARIDGPADAFVTVGIGRVLADSACLLNVEITAPAAGSHITSGWIEVRGTVTGPVDVGVTVNGVRAEVALDHGGTADDPFPWFAEVRPGGPGSVTLVARAITATGLQHEAVRQVTCAPPDEEVLLRAIPVAGVAPFETAFDLNVDATSPAVLHELDLDGDGIFESSFTSAPDLQMITYPAPAVIRAAARVTLEDGRVLNGTTNVLVQSFAAVDAVLQAKWASFRELLGRGDVAGALEHLSMPSARAKYGPLLNAIAAGLPGYAAEVAQIYAKTISSDVAQYLIVRERDGQMLGYPLYFTRGGDGIWRITQF